MKTDKLPKITCRNCEQIIKPASSPAKGKVITCNCCGVNYEIVNVEPLEFVWLYREAVVDEEMEWFTEPYSLLGEGWWQL
jgi:transcription elongation factor Elf1